MAVPAQRRLKLNGRVQFGNSRTTYEVPDLTILQTRSYAEFLQADVPPAQRKNQGLEAVLREAFPMKSYEGTATLEYLYYVLEKPHYTPDECRRLRLTYGRPFRVRLKLTREDHETV
ncbi:MAG: hypothetical protein IIY32_02780, partial [Thermoguttaceae bacterium]|nr:hypothetical protein [Thermoguttaceae bacterium]